MRPRDVLRAIEDPDERAFFENLPTTLALGDETVDRLIEVGRRLLRESPVFQALLAELTPPHSWQGIGKGRLELAC